MFWVTFWAWGAFLGQLRLNLRSTLIQKILRGSDISTGLEKTSSLPSQKAVLIGTRGKGAHWLTEKQGIELTSIMAKCRAQTMSSGLNFPLLWGSSIVLVMITGAPRWPHSVLVFPHADKKEAVSPNSVSPQLQLQPGEKHTFSLTAFLGIIKCCWLWVSHVPLVSQLLCSWKCNVLIGLGLAHMLLLQNSSQINGQLPAATVPPYLFLVS